MNTPLLDTASAPASSPSRLVYLDMLRGLMMVLVVAQHSEFFVFFYNSSFSQTLGALRMPMFFFISGFLAYSSQLTNAQLSKRFWTRLVAQVYPSLLFYCVFIFFLSGEPYNKHFSFHLWGRYWFPFLLFEFFVFLFPVLCVARHLRTAHRRLLLFSLLTVGLVVLNYALTLLDDHYHKICFLIDSTRIWKYLSFFIFGAIAKELALHNVARNVNIVWWVVLTLSGFLLSFLLEGHGWKLDYLSKLSACLGVLGMFKCFQSIPTTLQQHFVGRFFAYVGTLTLEIYLLHYFFLDIIRWFLGGYQSGGDMDFAIHCRCHNGGHPLFYRAVEASASL